MLEHQLLAFVNASLVKDGRSAQPESRLFEDGYIDSIAVLELIAFIERTTGRRVPDRMVRFPHFRSVRSIAVTFGDVGEVTAPSLPVATYAADTRGAVSPVAALRESGELIDGPDGPELHGRARALLEFFDSVFAGSAVRLGARPLDVPERIAMSTLERAGFIEAFPQLLVPADGSSAFAPAACYHCYPGHSGAVLTTDDTVTVRARCHRAEREEAPLERQRVFTMREIVFFGTQREVEGVRRQLLETAGDLVTTLGLGGVVEAAEDPFFTTASRGRRLAQRAGALKLELRLDLGDERRVAVASFNHHHDHFGRCFGMTLADGTPAHSGCVAFGLERWVLAFLAQRGIDGTRWPDDVRAGVAARRERGRPA